MNEFGSPSTQEPETLTSESQINPNYVYALYNFMATLEGQISVLRGEEMELVDDSNSYWWACKLISTGDIGYIPAENVETPMERLARLNRSRNSEKSTVPPSNTKSKETGTKIKFADSITVINPDGVVSDELIIPKESKESRKRISIFQQLFKSIKKDSFEATVSAPAIPTTTNAIASDNLNVLRVFAGNIGASGTFKSVSYDEKTTADQLLKNSLKKFRLQNQVSENYYMTVLELSGPRSGREIRLKDTDLVHETLTALGVSSLNSNGIGPADDSLKFIIYKIERQPVNKMLTFSYNQSTRDYVVKDITMLDLVKKVKSDFNIVGGIQMYNPDTEKYISDKAKAVQVYDKIQRDEKALIIITKSNSMTRSTQPKPLSALNTHKSIIEREQTPIAKSAGGSSINSASVDFDGMLDDLDTNIGFQKVKVVKLSTKMDNLEHEIDKLVATSPEKSQPKLLNKASRRLSKIHGDSTSPNGSPSKKDKHDPEAQDILEMIGTSKAELLAIEQNMMILVGQLLSKNGIIIK